METRAEQIAAPADADAGEFRRIESDRVANIAGRFDTGRPPRGVFPPRAKPRGGEEAGAPEPDHLKSRT